MDTCIEKIKETATRLLEEEKVETFIGFASGTIPMAVSPVAIKRKEDVSKLVFNSLCGLNLANYLPKLKGKIGIVAKGCDSRNIVTHIVENQIPRENLVIIGVPCKGMVDKKKIASVFNDEITSFSEDNDTIVVTSSTKSENLNKPEFLKTNCQLCMHRNPVVYDELACDLIEEQNLDNPFEDVDKIEAMAPEEKFTLFQDLTKNCIRCYACRNACPLCYCPTCFVDESDPQWVGKGQDKTDIDTFHFLRAFHCAGRCTDCGACVEACPMNIDVRMFTRKLIKDSYEMFGWEAGLDLKTRPPLDTYKPEDPDDFIK
jgi:ferredoxin